MSKRVRLQRGRKLPEPVVHGVAPGDWRQEVYRDRHRGFMRRLAGDLTGHFGIRFMSVASDDAVREAICAGVRECAEVRRMPFMVSPEMFRTAKRLLEEDANGDDANLDTSASPPPQLPRGLGVDGDKPRR